MFSRLTSSKKGDYHSGKLAEEENYVCELCATCAKTRENILNIYNQIVQL